MQVATMMRSHRNAYIIRMPFSPSYSIPLSIGHPDGINLISWCYVNAATSNCLPSCFLIIECNGDLPDCQIIVNTHSGDISLQPLVERLEDNKKQNERNAIIEMLLLALVPSKSESLIDLLSQFKSYLDDIVVEDGAPILTLLSDGCSPTLRGSLEVPFYMVCRIDGVYHYVHINKVKVKVGAVQELVLDCSFEASVLRKTERAIIVFGSTYLSVKIARN